MKNVQKVLVLERAAAAATAATTTTQRYSTITLYIQLYVKLLAALLLLLLVLFFASSLPPLAGYFCHVSLFISKLCSKIKQIIFAHICIVYMYFPSPTPFFLYIPTVYCKINHISMINYVSGECNRIAVWNEYRAHTAKILCGIRTATLESTGIRVLDSYTCTPHACSRAQI